MAGASPSPALLKQIEGTLAVPVRGVYGSTEGGGVTTRMLHSGDDPADVGEVLPGFELQVVDDAGTPVAPGTPGTVRYRSPGMVSGYLEDGTVVPFPGGWFSPGDTGALHGSALVLAGRTAELINIGGTKVDPVRIDEFAAGLAGIRDAAAFAIELRPGIQVLGLAVVAAPSVDLSSIDQAITDRFGPSHRAKLWRVSEIPRNRMGKAERSALASAFARQG